MFDAFKGMAGMASLMKDLPRIKARMAEIKEELANSTVEATAGGGAVVAVADGSMRLRSITVDPVMLSSMANANTPADNAIAESLMVGAVNAALEKAQAMVTERVAAAAQDLDIPLPAGGLGGLLGP
jgi:DNA-binding protein YbaB